jgi:hypothetical protein
MSQAFIDKWNRTPASDRLLTILAAIARRQGMEAMRIGVEELEQAEGFSITQEFINDELYLRSSNPSLQFFTRSRNQSMQPVERRPSWQDQAAANNPAPPTSASVLEDQELAAREARQEELKRRAREMRGQPLAVPTPPPPHDA